MIVLNISKEIVRVENWEDIAERPGFNGNLDPAKHSLDSILGRYAFAEKVSCGLSNCHAPHNRGYIVVTKDGHETNIGKDCGRTYFGVDFDTLSNRFDRDLTEKENREKLWSFFFKLEEVAAQLASIREGATGADWVHKQVTNVLDFRVVTSKIARKLNAMSKSRDARIFKEREATDEEFERMRAEGGGRVSKPLILSERLGTLSGIDTLYPENNLKAILMDDISTQVAELNGINIDALTYEQLSRWSKWIGSLDAKLEQARQVVQYGSQLFVDANLRPLAEAAELNTEELEQFTKYLKGLPSSNV